jgi:hypothetical protein
MKVAGTAAVLPAGGDEAAQPRVGIMQPLPAGAAGQAPAAVFLVLELVNNGRSMKVDELAHAFLALLPSSSAPLLDDADTTEMELAPQLDPRKTAVVRTFTVRLIALEDGRQVVHSRDHLADTVCTLVAQVR